MLYTRQSLACARAVNMRAVDAANLIHNVVIESLRFVFVVGELVSSYILIVSDCNAVSRINNAMPCHHSGYDRHDINVCMKERKHEEKKTKKQIKEKKKEKQKKNISRLTLGDVAQSEKAS